MSSKLQKKFEKSFWTILYTRKRIPGDKREKPGIQLTQSQPNQRFTGRWFSLKHVATALPNLPIRRECLSSTRFPDPVGLLRDMCVSLALTREHICLHLQLSKTRAGGVSLCLLRLAASLWLPALKVWILHPGIR